MTYLLILLFSLMNMNCSNNDKKIITEETDLPDFNGQLKVLSLNTWQEGTSVNGGFDAIVDIILQTEADIVLLSEIRNYNGTVFGNRIVNSLKIRNAYFYSNDSYRSPLILSKFPITFVRDAKSSSLTKCIVKLTENTSAALYAAHLDYTHYACYLPRGYSGITWQKLPEPILDVEKILEQNMASQRDEAIAVFIEDALTEKEKGNLVFLGGDFNEPSHLDWGEAMKNKFDHNGTIVPWHNSVTLQNNGFLDSYRIKYPDPVQYPGITWPAYNMDVTFSKLIWAAEADERDRIDFIYYYPNEKLTVNDIAIVGPVGSIANGEGVHSNPGEDKFITPNGIWPSDHKGVLATFNINTD